MSSNIKKTKLTALFVIAAMSIGILLPAMETKAADSTNVVGSSMAYVDGNLNICFSTRDHKRTGNLAYQTIGYTITRCYPGTQTPDPSKYVIFQKSHSTTSSADSSGGWSTNTYVISHTEFLEAIAADGWWQEIENSEEDVYIKIDSIMRIVDYSYYNSTTDDINPPGASGHLITAPTGNHWGLGTQLNAANGLGVGSVYNPDPLFYSNKGIEGSSGVYDYSNYMDLANAKRNGSGLWSSNTVSAIPLHYNIYLLYRGKKVKKPKLQDDLLTFETGKHMPTIFAWNEAAGGQYRLDQGIPSGENLEVGCGADSWYGNYTYCLMDTTVHQFYINYLFKLKYMESYPTEDGGYENEEEELELYWETDNPLELRAFYAVLWDANVYETDGKVDVINAAYDGGQVEFNLETGTTADLWMSGRDKPSYNDLENIHNDIKREAGNKTNEDTCHVDYPNDDNGEFKGEKRSKKVQGHKADRPIVIEPEYVFPSLENLEKAVKLYKDGVNKALEQHEYVYNAEAFVSESPLAEFQPNNGFDYGLYIQVMNDRFSVSSGGERHMYMSDETKIAPDKEKNNEAKLIEKKYETLKCHDGNGCHDADECFCTEPLKDMPRYCDCPNDYHDGCDYRFQLSHNDRKTSILIPSDTKNGYYDTTINAKYKRLILPRGDSTDTVNVDTNTIRKKEAPYGVYYEGSTEPKWMAKEDQERDEGHCKDFRHIYKDSDTFDVKDSERGKAEDPKKERYGGEPVKEGMPIHECIARHIWDHEAYYNGNYRVKNCKYINFEPLYVHTPVVAPISISNPSDVTQLVDKRTPDDRSSLNLRLDGLVEGNPAQPRYDLLLDDKYSIDFDAALHRKILGYSGIDGETTDPHFFDRFILQKWVKFPFDVQITGESYPTEETGGVAKKGTKQFYRAHNKEAIEGLSNTYTDWICVYDKENGVGSPSAEIEFYIPSWAEETVGMIQYKVKALNEDGRTEDYVNDDHQEDYDDTGEDDDDTEGPDHLEGEGQEKKTEIKPANSIATYKICVMTSGIMYDFKVLGSSDGSAYTNEKYNGSPITAPIAFAPQKEEKRVGGKNRLNTTQSGKWNGGVGNYDHYVRYALDGDVTNAWDTTLDDGADVLPLSIGSSHTYPGTEGYMKLGETINFSLKTISGKFNNKSTGADMGSCIEITPSYRYYDYMTGTETAVQMYYVDAYGNIARFDNNNDRDTNLHKYEARKTSENTEPNGDNAFKFLQAMNAGALWDLLNMSWGKYGISTPGQILPVTQAQVLANSIELYKYNFVNTKGGGSSYENYHDGPLIFTLEDEFTKTGQAEFAEFMQRSVRCRTMQKILLYPSMRIYSGQDEELAQNMAVSRNDGLYPSSSSLHVSTGGPLNWAYGATYEGWVNDSKKEDEDRSYVDFKDPNIQEEYMQSMQTWYGSFSIPEKLYVCYEDYFQKCDGCNDVDGDGVYDLHDFMESTGKSINDVEWINKNESKTNACGNIIVNLEITAREHLGKISTYDLTYGTNKNGGGMWKTEGERSTVKIRTQSGLVDVPTEPGDIAVIDIQEKSHAVTLGGVIAD